MKFDYEIVSALEVTAVTCHISLCMGIHYAVEDIVGHFHKIACKSETVDTLYIGGNIRNLFMLFELKLKDVSLKHLVRAM